MERTNLLIYLFSLVTLNFTASVVCADQPAGQPIVQLSKHVPPDEVNHCQDCHFKKKNPYIYPKKNLVRNHADKGLKHGKTEIACGSCHDSNHSNQLRTSKDAPASFDNPSPVCMQCHVDVFRDWKKGIHGKRMGGWNRDKTQFQCIDCHRPHSVTFEQMKADPPPKMPKLHVVPQESNKEP